MKDMQELAELIKEHNFRIREGTKLYEDLNGDLYAINDNRVLKVASGSEQMLEAVPMPEKTIAEVTKLREVTTPREQVRMGD